MIVNEEREPNSHPNTHELSLCPYIPKEILEFEFNELDFGEPKSQTSKNYHESYPNPGVDQEKDMNECSSKYSFDLPILEEDKVELQPNDSKDLT